MKTNVFFFFSLKCLIILTNPCQNFYCRFSQNSNVNVHQKVDSIKENLEFPEKSCEYILMMFLKVLGGLNCCLVYGFNLIFRKLSHVYFKDNKVTFKTNKKIIKAINIYYNNQSDIFMNFSFTNEYFVSI